MMQAGDILRSISGHLLGIGFVGAIAAGAFSLGLKLGDGYAAFICPASAVFFIASGVAYAVELRDHERDGKLIDDRARGTLKPKAEANGREKFEPPKDGGETPSPEFLKAVWEYWFKTKELPTVRDDMFRAMDINKTRAGAMFTRLVSWGMIEGRTESGAAGRFKAGVSYAYLAQYMTSERPDYTALMVTNRTE